ncbi:MAG: amino acid ABC transporter permease [Rhodoferax sp.]|nr:amino acid ABC transporter permease [Pseudorhodobacter sp.]
MTSQSYVRTEMVAAQKPPGVQTGIVLWMREKLFSSWLNAALTLVAVYAVYSILATVGPWFYRSVWTGSSLTECRATLAATYGEGVSGACFAVIRERWQQILFGFYPRELYWRPTLTLVLMLVALWPVLFSSAPRGVLWFSAAFPAVAFWLLWGGTVWLPVMILLGFAVGYLAYRLISPLNGLLGAIAAILAPIFWWLFLCGPAAELVQSVISIELRQLKSADFGGFLLSTVIGISGIVFSLPIGVLLALGRQSDLLIVRTVCVAFIEGFRGVPLITLLFVASLLLNYFLPPGTEFDVILRVIIMVTLFSAAYMAEVIRGGLAALPRGQYEAADALGLDYWKAQRLIIMPQALKITIPGIVGQFIGLFKDTTLVSFISLQDPLQLVSSIRANTQWNGVYWEPFLFVGFLFFIFCFSMSRYSMYLENKLKTDHR